MMSGVNKRKRRYSSSQASYSSAASESLHARTKKRIVTSVNRNSMNGLLKEMEILLLFANDNVSYSTAHARMSNHKVNDLIAGLQTEVSEEIVVSQTREGLVKLRDHIKENLKFFVNCNSEEELGDDEQQLASMSGKKTEEEASSV